MGKIILLELILINFISPTYAQNYQPQTSQGAAQQPITSSPSYMGTVGVTPGTDANGYPIVNVNDQTNPLTDPNANPELNAQAVKEKTNEEINQDHLSSQLNVLRGEQSTSSSSSDSGNNQLERLRAEQRNR